MFSFSLFLHDLFNADVFLYMYSYLLILNEKNKLKYGTCEIIINIFISFAKELTLIMVAVTRRACY